MIIGYTYPLGVYCRLTAKWVAPLVGTTWASQLDCWTPRMSFCHYVIFFFLPHEVGLLGWFASLCVGLGMRRCEVGIGDGRVGFLTTHVSMSRCSAVMAPCSCSFLLWMAAVMDSSHSFFV